MPEPHLTVAYLRVSTAQQREAETIETQRFIRDRYLETHNLKLDHSFEDDGVSGGIEIHRRPDGARLYQLIATGRVRLLLLFHSDRVGRDTIDTLLFHRHCEAAGTRILGIADGTDTAREGSELTTELRAVIAAELRRDASRRTKAGQRRRATKEGKISQRPPFGYIAPGGKLAPDGERADVMRRAFREYEQGVSMHRIVSRFRAEGLPSPTGKGWRRDTLCYLLKQRVYMGEYVAFRTSRRPQGGIIHRPASEQVIIPCPPLVSRETFERVQERMRSNHRSGRRSGEFYLLKGLLRCGKCGLAYISHTVRNRQWRGRSYPDLRYYQCSSSSMAETNCRSPNVPADELEAVIWGDLEAFLRAPEPILQAVAERLNRQARASKATVLRERSRIERARAKNQAARMRLVTALAYAKVSARDTALGLDTLTVEAERLGREEAALNERERAAARGAHQIAEARQLVVALRARRSALTPAARREIALRLVKEIVIERAGPRTIRAKARYLFGEKRQGRFRADESGNTSVTVNGRAAQLFYVSPTEIRFHVPPETATGMAEVIVRNHDGFETRGQATVAPAALGVFGQNGDGTGETVALDAMMLSRSPFAVDDPAGNARSVIVFATGARYASGITATIGGRAVAVEAVVAAPDLPGLDQVHIGLTPALRGAGVVSLILRAGGRASNTTTINIGGARRAASIALTPASASLAPGETVRFAATVRDEAGEILADAPIAFSASDPFVAGIDATGLATGIAPGAATITAASGAATASAVLRVFNRTLVINEVLADPPDGPAGDANRDGTRSAAQDEFIEIVNATGQDFDLSGYQLLTRATSDADVARHTFAAGTILPAGGCVVVFGGASAATFNPQHEAFGGAQVLLASTGGFSLTNTGSVVTLRAPDGAITDQMAYGSGAHLSGDRNQSLTRAPDVVGNFALHLDAPDGQGRIFSPGTRAGGAPFVSPAIARIEIEPATASINTGARQQFFARAFADDGRELTGVIFRWQSSDSAIATIDNTGAASGLSPGAVAITAAARGALSAPAQLVVREPERTLTRVEITPPAAAIYTHGEQQFLARAFDQNGQEMTGVVFMWSASDEVVAVVNQSGLAAAKGTGSATIIAAAQDGFGPIVAGAATLAVSSPPLVINEILADPPDGLAGDANRDGMRSGTEDEFIELVNQSPARQDIAGWTIRTRALAGTSETVRHTFAAGTALAAGDVVAIFGGGNFEPDHPAFGGAQVVRASSGGLSFANNGLTIILRDAANRLVAQVSYGTPHDDFAGDTVNQSFTRAPDTTGDFVRHTLAPGSGGRRFSPGTKADGSFFVARAGRLTRIRLEPLTASVVETLTTEFAAQAFDQFDRPLSDAFISFSARAAEIAAIETVNFNAATGGASATVRGLRAGATEISATATQGALSITSEPAQLTVAAAPPRVARLEVTPATAAINRGGTQQLNAQAYAPDGSLVTNATISWESSDPSIATVESASGLARGVGLGEVGIRATAPDGASGATTTGTATLTVRLPLVINELLADVPPDNAATLPVEGDANRDGARQADDDEFIEIINHSRAPADISGVRLADATGNRFTFPAGTILAGGQAAVVFGGGSPPAHDPAFGGALIFATGSLGLNDGGDTVTLKLTVGGAEISIAAQSYGTGGGPTDPAAPNDQSLTRAPDAESDAPGGDFGPHTAAANANGRTFSPGTRADGTPFGSPPLTRIEITPQAAAINTGETQTFAARAFSNLGGAEVEIPNVSFIWESSAPGVAELTATTGAQTTARGQSAGNAYIFARAGGQQGAAALTVNAIIARIELAPASATIATGNTQTFVATARDANGNALSGCSFVFSLRDASPPGVAAIAATTPDTVTVRGDQAGSVTVAVNCARPNDGALLEDTSALTIIPPPPLPQPGEVIINEALVSFASSTTQTRNDFVELYNTTDSARDISGLSLSFRPAGSGNTPRTFTLPGAVGSGATLILPRSYFLIVNGAETFGAAADYDASAIDFDLNGTTGGIKIELNGVKLDGLAYHPAGSSPPASIFLQYGEGAALTFTSGTTNDLLRSPDATDTNDNAHDFRRNGVAASVSPKAPNP